MSLDFAPEAYLEEHPMPPPRVRKAPLPPWRLVWAAAELDRGLLAADRIRLAIAGRTGRGVEIVGRVLWWAVPGLRDAYAALDANSLRQHAAVLLCVAETAADATNPLLPWWDERGGDPDGVAKYNAALDTMRAWATEPCPACGMVDVDYVWQTIADGRRQLRAECPGCGRVHRFVKQTGKAKDAADDHEQRVRTERAPRTPELHLFFGDDPAPAEVR